MILNIECYPTGKQIRHKIEPIYSLRQQLFLILFCNPSHNPFISIKFEYNMVSNFFFNYIPDKWQWRLVCLRSAMNIIQNKISFIAFFIFKNSLLIINRSVQWELYFLLYKLNAYYQLLSFILCTFLYHVHTITSLYILSQAFNQIFISIIYAHVSKNNESLINANCTSGLGDGKEKQMSSSSNNFD